jgi:hypothetical protein
VLTFESYTPALPCVKLNLLSHANTTVQKKLVRCNWCHTFSKPLGAVQPWIDSRENLQETRFFFVSPSMISMGFSSALGNQRWQFPSLQSRPRHMCGFSLFYWCARLWKSRKLKHLEFGDRWFVFSAYELWSILMVNNH